MPTDAEREQSIRKQNARLSTPDCQCAHCFLLRLLDAERARADATEAKAAAMEANLAIWKPQIPTCRICGERVISSSDHLVMGPRWTCVDQRGTSN